MNTVATPPKRPDNTHIFQPPWAIFVVSFLGLSAVLYFSGLAEAMHGWILNSTPWVMAVFAAGASASLLTAVAIATRATTSPQREAPAPTPTPTVPPQLALPTSPSLRNIEPQVLSLPPAFSPPSPLALGSGEPPQEHVDDRQPGLDKVTRLHDASSIISAFSTAVSRTTGSGGMVALVMIDLREFQVVNDMFGRANGDLALRAIASRIAESLTPDDTVVRLAGDEFLVIRYMVGGIDEIDDLAIDLLNTLKAPLEIQTYKIVVGANLGIAVASPPATELAKMLSDAGTALFRSKRQGENRYEIFGHSPQTELSPAVVATWLRSAIDNFDLKLRYQPIQSLVQGNIAAVEATLRWDHPEFGLLSSETVLPALDESGLIVEVGCWSDREVCRQMSEWRDEIGASSIPITFIPIATKHLAGSTFLSSLERSIEEFDVNPANICLELSGLSRVPASSHVWMVLRECKALGVLLALEDFGDAGSFDVLRRLRLDYLKLGNQLVSGHRSTPTDSAIASSVVGLANELGVRTIAVGIDDRSSLDRAKMLGCDLAQGLLLGSAELPSSIDALVGKARTPIA